MGQMGRLGPYSVSEDLGFKSHQVMNHVGFYSLGRSYPDLGCCGPNGKAGTTLPSFVHFTDACLIVLL